MRKRTLRAVDTWFTREEPIGFLTQEVDYHVGASVTPGRRGYGRDPGEEDEVDLVTVARLDPFTGVATELPSTLWPFSDDDIDIITQQIVSRPGGEDDDYDCDDEDPPDRDDDDFYDEDKGGRYHDANNE